MLRCQMSWCHAHCDMSHACHTLSTYKTNSVECAVMSFEHHHSPRGSRWEIWPRGWQHCHIMRDIKSVTRDEVACRAPWPVTFVTWRERGALSSCPDPLSFVYLSPQSREKKLLLLSLTFFWLVVPVLAKLPVVVLDELVVVVLLARPLGPL